MKTSLTVHARTRLRERTKLEESVFLYILDSFRTASVRYQHRTSLGYRLFYSSPDERYFVAIQNMTDGDVITVLPLDYYENVCGKVPTKKLKKAMLRVDPKRHDEVYAREAPTDGVPFEIIGIFWKPDMTKLTKGLGIFRFSQIPASGEEAAENDALMEKICRRMREKHLDALDVDDIVLSAKQEGVFYKLPWERVASFSLSSDPAQDGAEMTGDEESADGLETSDFEESCLVGAQY